MEKIMVFTDGSSRGNPGPGGWGAIIIDASGKVVELGGREDNTTNNRMELAAAKEALQFIETRKISGDIQLHTDSAYLLNGITGWMYGWEKNGWKTKTGEDVLNQDLWKDIGAIVYRMKLKRVLEWEKVEGHAGQPGNERADEIATAAADQKQQILFIGNLTEYEKMLGVSLFDFAENTPASHKTKSPKGKNAYSYVSMINGMIETHATWQECEKRVKGKAAKFKKAFSKEEETELISAWTKKHLEQES